MIIRPKEDNSVQRGTFASGTNIRRNPSNVGLIWGDWPRDGPKSAAEMGGIFPARPEVDEVWGDSADSGSNVVLLGRKD